MSKLKFEFRSKFFIKRINLIYVVIVEGGYLWGEALWWRQAVDSLPVINLWPSSFYLPHPAPTQYPWAHWPTLSHGFAFSLQSTVSPEMIQSMVNWSPFPEKNSLRQNDSVTWVVCPVCPVIKCFSRCEPFCVSNCSWLTFLHRVQCVVNLLVWEDAFGDQILVTH